MVLWLPKKEDHMTRKEAIEALAKVLLTTTTTPEELMTFIEDELGMYPPMDNKGNFKWKAEGKKDGV